MSAKLKTMFERAKRTLKSNEGQGLVEYALILVLIALVVLAALTGIGTNANTKFQRVNSALQNNGN